MQDSLGDRMKRYENVNRTYLTRRTPVIIRVDGKAFHTFTKGFQKPFDNFMIRAMQTTMQCLCENIQGCVFGYTQSDEITIVLVDYQTLETGAWFEYNVQKMCSVAASMATLYFNQFLSRFCEGHITDVWTYTDPTTDYKWVYYKAMQKGATFDARVFNIPKEEVCNNIFWRQLDAMRNSIQAYGRAYFTDRELYQKSTTDIKSMTLSIGHDWDKLCVYKQRGSSCIKRATNDGHSQWYIDEHMPILKGTDRAYIDNLIYIGE